MREESPARSSSSEEILVVNRDPEMRALLSKALFVANISSSAVTTSEEAFNCLEHQEYALVLVSVESPESLATIARLRERRPDATIAAVSRLATPELVRDVLKAGADDFIFGTVDGRRLVLRLKAMMRDRAVSSRRAGPRAAGGGVDSPAAAAATREASPVEIICRNSKMKRVLEIAGRIAPTDSTVLIQGESGTGKELIARWIHEHSQRTGRPFVAVNCGALPESLLESQLFGHEKGSFTGAVQRQLGLFEVSDNGTLFLDEIGEMSLDMQVKLLRVLQSTEFRRIGGSQVVKVNVRVLAATNRDLKMAVEKGAFRTDLYYRLNVISLDLPPLRERREEIPVLVASFAERLAREKGLPGRAFSPEAVETLQKYRWDGNIRELENAVERLVLLAPGEVVERADVEEHLEGQVDPGGDLGLAATLTLDEVKKIHITRVLRENRGNKMRTARILGINVKTLYNMIRNLDIQV